MADIYRVDNVVSVVREFARVDGFEEGLRVDDSFDAFHGESEHIAQCFQREPVVLLGIAHCYALGTEPVGINRRVMLHAAVVEHSRTFVTFQNLSIAMTGPAKGVVAFGSRAILCGHEMTNFRDRVVIHRLFEFFFRNSGRMGGLNRFASGIFPFAF